MYACVCIYYDDTTTKLVDVAHKEALEARIKTAQNAKNVTKIEVFVLCSTYHSTIKWIETPSLFSTDIMKCAQAKSQQQ